MAMTEAAQPTRPYRLGALAHRNFRLFFIGQGISLVGTWLQNVGEGWLILTLTTSPFYVGLTSALSSVGVLLFSLYAGEGWLILTLTNSPFYVGLTSAL